MANAKAKILIVDDEPDLLEIIAVYLELACAILQTHMKTSKIISLSYFYLLFGFVCGFLLGTSLNKETSAIIAKLVLLLSIVVIAIFGKRIESALHNIDIQNWSTLRRLSKWYFVITRYVLFRGLVLFTLFVLPVFSTVRFSSVVFITSVLAFLLLAAILAYFGLEEWKNSEQEYAIRLLRNAGEQARIIQN